MLATDEARWRSFAVAIDAIGRRARARVGPDDLAQIRRVDEFSRRCETLGRARSPRGDRETRGPRTGRARFFSKLARYFSRELGLFPLLAGPRFARVFVGNLLSEGMRDVYTAATIYCGHVGARVASFPAGTRAKTKGERYAMQVAASNDFAVPWTVSVLCGGLDMQIEHHLFPTLPPQRLREISSEVRTACEAHAAQYNTASWPRTLWRAAVHMCRLSLPNRVCATA